MNRKLTDQEIIAGITLETVADIENLPVTIRYVGCGRSPWDKNNNVDQWTVTIGQSQPWIIPFYMGVGCRKKDKPVKPKIAEILHCLIRDASARDMNFLEWCSEYDENTDSIKAHELYMRCSDIGLKLNRTFGRETIEKLQYLLQDY